MLPTLLRRCTALCISQPCQQLVSLTAFHAHRLSELSARNYTAPNQATYGTSRREVRAFSRKRNIFLDPSERDETMNSLTELYGTSRFNDDDDWENEAQEVLNTTPTEPDAEEIDDEVEEQDGETIVKLPPARNVRVKTAEFIKSSVDVKQCPPALFPEFAVIGRSNVGKSSLINLLTGRNSLAMVSKTPGKTRCINHFFINKSWYLVDLPGYGYAKTSKDNVIVWNKFTREYFIERETLVMVLLLIDASIPPMPIDIACANWLGDAEVPYTLVYTKVDKRKKGVPPAEENIAAFEAKLAERWEHLPSAVATSSRSGTGKSELLAHIARLRSLYNKNEL